MDETPITGEPFYRKDGFENQRLCVVPRPQVEAALERAGTRRMTVTDAGHFPLREATGGLARTARQRRS